MSRQPGMFTVRMLLLLLLGVVLAPMLPLLVSWRWSWWEAWVYAAICILGFVVSRALAARRNPGLIAERAQFMRHQDTASFDRLLAPLSALGSGLIPLIAGLDERFRWSPAFSLPVKIAALVAMLAGTAIASSALIANPFFSGTVRIQSERGHRVVSSGPYRWVRHPGYAGGLITYLTTPLWLDSAWALIPAVAVTVSLVVRTALEDRTLQDQLEGYREYAGRVRYRLLPGIW